MSRPLSAKTNNGHPRDLNINPKVSNYYTNGSGRVIFYISFYNYSARILI